MKDRIVGLPDLHLQNSNVSNIPEKVDDAVAGTEGFSEIEKLANKYVFDDIGNLTSDTNKGYLSIATKTFFTRFRAFLGAKSPIKHTILELVNIPFIQFFVPFTLKC